MWRATQGQKSTATRLRIFAAISWVIAIGTEIFGVVMLRQHKFDHGNLPLLIGILVAIAIFAIAGSLMWKAANKHDPASRAELASLIEDYRRGLVPLVVPLTLCRHYVRRIDVAYLEGQLYLEPHPRELMLRNHV